MRLDQLERCAARLPARERAEFLELHRQAADVIKHGWELRRQAWALYAPYKPEKVKR